jgi:RNA polymerase sigma-70 factor (ECF subfamily)
MLGEPAEAEDVTQETFLRLWRAAPDWRAGVAQVATYAHRITVNLCLDRLRRSGRLVAGGEAPDAPDPAPLAPELLEAEDRAAAVRAALARLPERQRAAIALTVFDGLSHAEAGAILDISADALESLAARARRALRLLLADLKEDAA